MKMHWQAPSRNAAPIADVLQRILAPQSLVLEIASSTGQHSNYFAERFPDVEWQPSEHSNDCIASISAWREESSASNILPPIRIDVCQWPWSITQADVVFCANMIHIAPWECCEGLMRGSGNILSEGGELVLYGPFLVDGVPTAQSNIEFDRSLRERDSSWGIRNLADVEKVAQTNGLTLSEQIEMPANNRIVRFSKIDSI